MDFLDKVASSGLHDTREFASSSRDPQTPEPPTSSSWSDDDTPQAPSQSRFNPDIPMPSSEFDVEEDQENEETEDKEDDDVEWPDLDDGMFHLEREDDNPGVGRDSERVWGGRVCDGSNNDPESQPTYIKMATLDKERFEVEVDQQGKPLNKPKIDYYGKLQPKKEAPPKHVLDVVKELKKMTGNHVEMDPKMNKLKQTQAFMKSKVFNHAPELEAYCGCDERHSPWLFSPDGMSPLSAASLKDGADAAFMLPDHDSHSQEDDDVGSRQHLSSEASTFNPDTPIRQSWLHPLSREVKVSTII
ncbi:uncharacterized protein BKCO1_1100050 [Diplodia corticola]|uniref:Uncharacterized protein n=1 Tax=Diplodia corticola TaxID=236234 RepID=A0A1J9S960_9PEZI|nr:uncharacterized protein BKCO1_1100050 [Diplodia corticola]OJD36436.1 hypothetical protein BKCO1_1100050 [Diplodia corticola]